MDDREWFRDVEQRLQQQDALILGLKKELGMLRNRLNDRAPSVPHECRLGLGEDCTRASTYQYQQGCRGDRCAEARSDYYGKRPKEVVVEPPKKKVMKRAPRSA